MEVYLQCDIARFLSVNIAIELACGLSFNTGVAMAIGDHLRKN